MDAKTRETITYFEEQIAALRDDVAKADLKMQVEYTEMKDFRVLLSAVNSLINHHNFTALFLKDAAGNAASRELVASNLRTNFGITDDESAVQGFGRACYRGTHWQFAQFVNANDAQYKQDIEKMSPKARTAFLAAKEFSDAMRENISPKGYIAWDISLGVEILREALFCDYCNEPGAEKLIDDVLKPVLKMFNNWMDYAVSLIAGGTYAAYKNSGYNIDTAKETFDYLVSTVRKLFLDETCNVWTAFNWYKAKEYFPTINQADLKPLLDTEKGCFVSDRISVDGEKPCLMYREEPFNNFPDSGWRFFAGDESEEYKCDMSKSNIFPLNVVANFDESIIPLLGAEINTAFIRKPDGEFIEYKTMTDAMHKSENK